MGWVKCLVWHHSCPLFDLHLYSTAIAYESRRIGTTVFIVVVAAAAAARPPPSLPRPPPPPPARRRRRRRHSLQCVAATVAAYPQHQHCLLRPSYMHHNSARYTNLRKRCCRKQLYDYSVLGGLEGGKCCHSADVRKTSPEDLHNNQCCYYVQCASQVVRDNRCKALVVRERQKWLEQIAIWG